MATIVSHGSAVNMDTYVMNMLWLVSNVFLLFSYRLFYMHVSTPQQSSHNSILLGNVVAIDSALVFIYAFREDSRLLVLASTFCATISLMLLCASCQGWLLSSEEGELCFCQACTTPKPTEE